VVEHEPRRARDGIAPHRTASHRIASHRIASHRIASHRTASHRIASHRIASHRIASHRIASHRIASHSYGVAARLSECQAHVLGVEGPLDQPTLAPLVTEALHVARHAAEGLQLDHPLDHLHEGV
jgi:hypothetical protein